jgi:hypothetical protein
MTKTNELERASAPGRALAEAVEDGKVRMTEILKSVGIDPANPAHQAALLACERYQLDPLLKHIIVIKGNVYVTTDGYRFHAEQTGEHNGTVVVETGETPTHHTATVSVWRKGVDHPFTFPGRYPKAGTNKQYGIEMAIVRAERNALARAFPIAGVRAEPDADRGQGDTSALVAEIVEHKAVKEWVAEHGDPEVLAELEVEAEIIDHDTGEMFPDDAA